MDQFSNIDLKTIKFFKGLRLYRKETTKLY